ncbi:Rrf2 family transcriptional regulator [Marinilabiliaceae bacterium ANBcel2]|nr:Rrf2 family transcriptional regulator [Marinilabiliaceae bacterium ANBcel2]
MKRFNKFSKKIYYGLRFLFVLCLRKPEVSSVAYVAKREKVPVKYLESVAGDLRRAGLIDVKKGAGGGYLPLLPLKAISLADVVAALEDQGERSFEVTSPESKAVANFLYDTGDFLHGKLADIKLDELTNYYKDESALMYHI